MDFSYFQKINNMYNAKSKKEVQLYHLKKHINERFTDTIDFYSVIVNDHPQDLLIIRTNDEYIKTIKSRPYEDFNAGDYIIFDNNTWIVISKDVCNQAYTSGKMQLCTYTLKFQHPQTGKILSYPCITSNRIQGYGDKETDVGILPSGNKVVLLPLDQNTILLQNSDKKTWRFFLDNHPTRPRPYRLTFTDSTSRLGLIELYCTEDKINLKTDNIELGICDYFEPITTPPSSDKYISIESDGKLVVGGIQRTFTANLIVNGVIQSFNPIWTIDYNNMPEKCFIVMYDGNKCMIKVKDDYDIYKHIGEYITIMCSTDDGMIKNELKVTIAA